MLQKNWWVLIYSNDFVMMIDRYQFLLSYCQVSNLCYSGGIQCSSNKSVHETEHESSQEDHSSETQEES